MSLKSSSLRFLSKTREINKANSRVGKEKTASVVCGKKYCRKIELEEVSAGGNAVP
jgi:hypothetical protein